MKYCPKCRAEYKDEINVCKDCKKELINSLQDTEKPIKKYGYPSRRLGALIIDNIILAIPLIALFLLFGKNISQYIFSSEFGNPLFKNRLYLLNAILFGIAGIISVTYGTIFIGKYSATIGHKLTNLKVITEEERVLGYKKAFIRALVYLIHDLPYVGGILMIASGIMLFSDKKRQALHDKICKTIVVNTK